MKQKQPNILREVQGNKVFPVYLLCGEESFLIEGTLKQMIETLLPPDARDFNLTYLDGANVSVRDILSHVEVYPLMSERRVVVVSDSPLFAQTRRRGTSPATVIRTAMRHETDDVKKCVTSIAKLIGVSTLQIANEHPDFNTALQDMSDDMGDALTEEARTFFKRLPKLATQLEGTSQSSSQDKGGADDAARLLEWLQGSLPKTGVLIFTVKGDVSEKHPLAKAIQEVGRYVTFAPLEAGNSINRDPLYKKVVEKFETHQKKISPRAFALLRNRTGGDMRTIAEAINKIIDFVGDKHQIDEQDVRNMVTQTTFDNIFDLTDAIAKRATGRALKSLHEVLAGGHEPIVLNAAIASQFRFALQAKLISQRNGKPIGGRMSFPDFTKNVFQPLADELADLLPKSATYNILKKNPYVAYKLFQTLHAFTADELMNALEKILEADLQLKPGTGTFDATYILEQGRLKIVSPVKEAKPLEAICILEKLVCDICTTPKRRR